MRRILLPLLLIASLLAGLLDTADARKSPRRHRVSGYTKKDGTVVRSYMRGSGGTTTDAEKRAAATAALGRLRQQRTESQVFSPNRTYEIPANGNWRNPNGPYTIVTETVTPTPTPRPTVYWNSVTKAWVPIGYAYNRKINQYVWIGKGPDPRSASKKKRR
jgi:hypothetical protein